MSDVLGHPNRSEAQLTSHHTAYILALHLGYCKPRCKLYEFIGFLCSGHVTYQIWSGLPKLKATSNRTNMAKN